MIWISIDILGVKGMGSEAKLTAAIDARIRRVERAIEDQKAFLHRVPDPDTREKADAHLLELVDVRDRMRKAKLEQVVVR